MLKNRAFLTDFGNAVPRTAGVFGRPRGRSRRRRIPGYRHWAVALLALLAAEGGCDGGGGTGAGSDASVDAAVQPRADARPDANPSDVADASASPSPLSCDEPTSPPVSDTTPCATGDATRAACVGRHCEFSECQFIRATSKGGACTGAVDLALSCDESLTMLADGCGRIGAIAPQGDELARSCLDDQAGRAGASAECIHCYADFVVCARAECSGECFAGAGEECDRCAESKGCYAPFYVCSGLPAITLE